MLEWTGERFLPWRSDPELAYEHLHRYFYACQFVSGKSVLDLGSGEGYGADMLAATARSVVGIDIDPAAVAHARKSYPRDGLQFINASITQIPLRDAASFDVITCFEAIEHIEDHAALLAEVRRLLVPGGLLIVSTPNKTAYGEHRDEENPFHMKELEFEEFRALLEGEFSQVRYLGQRIFAESNLWPVAGPGSSSVLQFAVVRENERFAPASTDTRVPQYFVALATNSPAPLETPPSILSDYANELLEQFARELKESRGGPESALEWRRLQVADLNQQLEEVRKALAWREETLRSLESSLEWSGRVLADLQAGNASQHEALAWREEQVGVFERSVANLNADKQELLSSLRRTEDERASVAGKLAAVSDKLFAIENSAGWKLLTRTRDARNRLFPAGSRRRHLVDRLISAKRRSQDPA